jgi:fibro-slime domain-containing protein
MAKIVIGSRLAPVASRPQLAWVALASLACVTVACGNATIIDEGRGGSGGGNAGSGGGVGGGGGGNTGGPFVKTDAAPIPDGGIDRPSGGNCGDGVIQRNEGCDDGNTTGGDGCSRICQVENNYECPTEGQPCVSIAICGNSRLTSDETCDDGNKVDGDGCSADCSAIEPGFQCRVPGKPCTPKCGDGIISPPPGGTETCDDGNTDPGDGCSTTCHLELGWKCEGTPTKCTKTTCGDGKKEGAESCDDGNATPFDGCSMDCQIEPKCTAGSGCSSQCGDAIVLGEGCDDGNAGEGDGCSKSCAVEPGWTCEQPPIGDSMKVPVIYRDFKKQNPFDFEGGITGSYDATTGIVATSLNDKGKPVLSASPPANAHIRSADTFAQWYTDVSGVNHATSARLTLWNDGKGNYVNRYGANGEQWNTTAPANYCGTVVDSMLDDEGDPIPCTFKYQYDADTNPTGGKTDCQKMEDQGYERLEGSCKSNNGTWVAAYIVAKQDGNPLFFPVDGDTFTPATELSYAQIPPFYDASKSWPKDLDASGKERLHNFSFTSEVRYWFPFDKSKSYTLDFVGDDDVWVFINGKLAVDLGGVHTPVNGTIVIGADGNGTTTVTSYDATGTPNPAKKSTATLGLQDKKVYEIAVFQAERQTTSSSYKLTLSGFNAAPSECKPKCGDGEVVADEECDCGEDPDKVPDRCTGPNDDNLYGGCSTTCTWGTFCGDGETNGPEECDDGKLNGTDQSPNQCTLGCTKQHFCGDGKSDTDRGEECDLGDKNGQKLDSQLEPSSDPTAQVFCTLECTIPPSIVY